MNGGSKPNPITLKMLILAESARITELLNTVPEDQLKNVYRYEYSKAVSELKAKMAELRRDSIALEKLLYGREVNHG